MISGSFVTLDLNNYDVMGTIEIAGTSVNVTVQNGNVIAAGPINAADAALPAIRIDSLTNYALLKDLYVLSSSTTTTAGEPGRDGIDSFGSNVIITNCVILSGTGQAGVANSPGGAGGVGITSAGTNVQIIDCTISTGAGGNGGASTNTNAVRALELVRNRNSFLRS